MARSTASDIIKNAINSKNKLFTKPAITSARTYPYEYLSFAFHLVITEAAKPANSPVQSKNIWNESDIRPKENLQKKNLISTKEKKKKKKAGK